MKGLVKIRGEVQAYAWGGTEFLPRLLGSLPGYNHDAATPQAEYWLGAHPSARARIEGGDNGLTVDEFLQQHQSPPLQFLLKILDVRDMLSIQVHPTKEQAAAGFQRENNLGIALTAKNRNYKDANDKPELMVALSDFWLLHGFKSPTHILAGLSPYPYLQPVRTMLQEAGLAAAFAFVLDIGDTQVQEMQRQLATELLMQPALQDKNLIEFWIRRWLEKNPTTLDGLLTLYFLNLVHLNAGEAIYQPAGLLHAYLEGQNVELMANSDNVLRAGLTPKHIDVPELLRICRVQATDPADYWILPQLEPGGERRFVTPFPEFELTELAGDASTGLAWRSRTPEILFCYKGAANLQTPGGETIKLNQGESVLVLPDAEVRIEFRQAGSTVYKARNL